EVETVALRRLHGEYAPAEDSQEDEQPRDDHPAGEEVDRDRGDHEEQHAREKLDLALGRDERLPEEEEAEMHQQPRALELATGRGYERRVQREEHRQHDPAPARRHRDGQALGSSGLESHALLVSAGRQRLSEGWTPWGSAGPSGCPA